MVQRLNQLAIGILLYKILTDSHPFEGYRNNPYWEKQYVGWNGCLPQQDVPSDSFNFDLLMDSHPEIYPFITTIPGWWDNFSSLDYVESIKSYLKDSQIINTIIDPRVINPKISNLENELVISLITTYLPYEEYIQIVLEILRIKKNTYNTT